MVTKKRAKKIKQKTVKKSTRKKAAKKSFRSASKKTAKKSSRLSLLADVPDETHEERRRIPRIGLSSILFRLTTTGKVFSVFDLSLEGMALSILDHTDLHVFPVGVRIEGVLNIRGERHDVQAKVVHLGGELVGCRFEKLAPAVLKMLRLELSPEVLGKDLRLFPMVEADWYHSTSGTDLFVWKGAKGEFQRFFLSVLGTFIQCESDLRTGKIQSYFQASEIHGLVQMGNLSLRADRRADQVKLKVAKNLVMGSNLPSELKKWLVKKVGSVVTKGA